MSNNTFRAIIALTLLLLLSISTNVLADSSITLNLKGDKKTYTLDPLSRQGSRSYVFQVVGGWGTKKTPAIAKLFLSAENDADDIINETVFAKLATQWLADGKDATSGADWLILKDLMSPEVSGDQMYHFLDIIEYLPTKQECEDAIEAAPGLVKKAAKKMFGRGVAFYDLSQLSNIVFNFAVTKADLLDMGGATSPTQVLSYQTEENYLNSVKAMVAHSIRKNEDIQRLIASKTS